MFRKIFTSSVIVLALAACLTCPAQQPPSNETIIPAKQVKEMNALRNGSLSGIGAILEKTNDQIVITDVIPGGPADKAGLKAGRVITAINDIPTAQMKIEDARSLVLGPKGSQVELTMSGSTDASLQKVAIIRDKVTLPEPVATGRVLDGNVGLLTVPGFTENAAKTVTDILESFNKNKVMGVVLDLRGNGGGWGTAAIEVTSLFTGNEPVLWRLNKAKQVDTVHGTRAALWQNPLVALVDGKTASAGELMASALQTSGRAKLLGQRTFGKGVVKQPFSQPDGALKLTVVAYFLTAGGDPIDGHGIKPDVEMDANMSNEEVLRKAVGLLQNQKDMLGVTIPAKIPAVHPTVSSTKTTPSNLPASSIPLGENKIVKNLDLPHLRGNDLARVYRHFTGHRVIISPAASCAEFAFIQPASPENPLTYAKAAELLRKTAALANVVFTPDAQDPNLDIITVASEGIHPTVSSTKTTPSKLPASSIPLGENKIVENLDLPHLSGNDLAELYRKYTGRRVTVSPAASATWFAFMQPASDKEPLTYAKAAELLRKTAALANVVFTPDAQDPNLDIITLASEGTPNIPLAKNKTIEPWRSGVALAGLYRIFTGRRVIVTSAAAATEFSFIQKAGKKDPLSFAAAAELLKKAATLENFAFVPHPNDPKIDVLTPSADGIRLPVVGIDVLDENDELPKGDAVITYVMTLNHIAPDKVINLFTQSIGQYSPSGSIAAVPIPNGSAIIITEYTSRVRKLIDLKKELDKPGSGQGTRSIPVR